MSIDNIATIRNAIKKISGENESWAECNATITAYVNGEKIITNKEFAIVLKIDTSFGQVSIMWEESGRNNYKDLGLPGTMHLKNNKFIDTGNDTFKIIDHDNRYEINVNYNNAQHINHLRK